MFDLSISLLLFLFSVVIHLWICRQQKKYLLLIKVFLGMSGFGLLIFWGASFLFHQSLSSLLTFSISLVERRSITNSLWTRALPVSSTILYILLILLYLSFYVNVKLISPSKKIMTLIRDQGAMTYEELKKYFTDSLFIQPRLDELIDSGCTYIEKGRYRLSESGMKIGRLLEMYQKILGRPMGG